MRVKHLEEVVKLIERFNEIEIFPVYMSQYKGLDYLMDIKVKITLKENQTLVTQEYKRNSTNGRAHYDTLLESLKTEKEEIRTKLKELGVNMEDRINIQERLNNENSKNVRF